VNECTSDVVFTGCTFSQHPGNGVNLHRTAAEFVDCLFEKNWSVPSAEENDEDGPLPSNGVGVRGDETTPVFTQCTFAANEMGISSLDGAAPTLTSCTFEDNGVGIYATGGRATLTDCTLRKSQNAAVWVDNEASGTAVNCTIADTQKVGVLIEGPVSEFTFTNCQFTGTVEAAGVGVKDKGNVVLKNCTLFGNRSANVDLSAGGTATIENSEVSSSVNGIGVKITGQGSTANITGSTLWQEKQSAVFIESQATCTVADCDIAQCGTCGVCVRNAGGSFVGNKIHDMEAIQVEGGTPSLCKNEVFNCKTHGVHIAAGSEPEVVDNSFRGIGGLDVNRE
jgi:hypothetical protein